jgi:hypothetical protein
MLKQVQHDALFKIWTRCEGFFGKQRYDGTLIRPGTFAFVETRSKFGSAGQYVDGTRRRA